MSSPRSAALGWLTRRRALAVALAVANVATAAIMISPARAASDTLPLEALHTADVAGNADEIMRDGWVTRYGTVALDLPIAWATVCQAYRSWDYSLHAWDWLAPVLHAWDTTGDRRYLDWAVDRAVSWAETFNDGTHHGTMAWYDMAIGMRSYRLAFLVEQAQRANISSEKLDMLNRAVYVHQSKLTEDRAFNPNSNHGFYVAVGQLAFSRRLASYPGMADVAAQARSRMHTVAVRQFAGDGGHREHSPGYHHMVLRSFRSARDSGLITNPDVLSRIRRAEEVLGWFVMPNGELPTVGDTSAMLLRDGATRSADPYTDFILTGGTHGRPNPRQLKLLPSAGYAAVRSPQPRRTDDHERSSYLLLSAGFHSRTHKHADDLSVVWFDRGREILMDAGKYGYVHKPLPSNSSRARQGFLYDSPYRQYVETTAAHNTVAADGRDHQRLDRRPYGSAIVDGQERDGHFRIRAAVNHGAWRHQREIVLRPGRWMQVTDVVTALDGRRHDFRVWWNFPGELRPVPVGAGSMSIVLPGSADALWVTELGQANTIGPRTAQDSPLRGYRSREDLKLIPSWSTGFEALNVRSRTFRTLFHFGEAPRTAGYRHPWS